MCRSQGYKLKTSLTKLLVINFAFFLTGASLPHGIQSARGISEALAPRSLCLSSIKAIRERLHVCAAGLGMFTELFIISFCLVQNHQPFLEAEQLQERATRFSN